jgi:cell division protein FtsB
MRSTRLLNAVFLLAFLVIASFAGSYALERYRKLEVMRSSEAKAATQLLQMQIAASSKRVALARLNHDPEYVERLIRQKLNYAKAGETVFKFEYDGP